MTDITAARQHDPHVVEFLQRHVDFQERIKELERENGELVAELDKAREKIAGQERIIRATADSLGRYKARCVEMSTEISGISALCLRALETSKRMDWRDNGGENAVRQLPRNVPQLHLNEIKP
jgi:chromosome segregation ATPase